MKSFAIQKYLRPTFGQNNYWLYHNIKEYMESQFSNKQIVWAKVKGYPWWPAEIAKLPTADSNLFKVVFIAEETHAFLNPRDVRKYSQYYDECSKKKMRGLSPAIQAADQIFKKRIESLPKSNAQCGKEEMSPQKVKMKNHLKTKNIRKAYNRGDKGKLVSSSQEQQDHNVEQASQQRKPSKLRNAVKVKQSQQQQIDQKADSDPIESSSKSEIESQSIQQQKFLNESQEKVDRGKIDSIEEVIYKHIEEIKQSSYKYSFDHYKQINIGNLSDEELLQSKITNMLSFIIHSLKKQLNFHQNSRQKDQHLAKEKQELKQLISLQKQLKERIIHYLNDTSYYDQYLKLIQRNKKNRNDYENKLILYLKSTYKIKKQLALIFASRLMTEINNGAIVKEKELMDDIKEKRIEISNINNKAAIDRNIENLIPKYM